MVSLTGRVASGTAITVMNTVTTTGMTGAMAGGMTTTTTEKPAALHPDLRIRVQLFVYTYSLAWQMLLNKS
jgi:hypothetical protein